jgi:hypothetical protein
MMMKPIAQDNFITHINRLRLHVQVQLFQPARNHNMVREGAKPLFHITSEALFPALQNQRNLLSNLYNA